MKPAIYFKNKIKRWRKKVKQEKISRKKNRNYYVKKRGCICRKNGKVRNEKRLTREYLKRSRIHTKKFNEVLSVYPN